MSMLARLLCTLGLLVLAWSTPASAGAGDTLFADGFDPCCRLGGGVLGLEGNGLSLRLVAGAINEVKSITPQAGQPRRYAFSSNVPPGTNYSVSVVNPPSGQTCTLQNSGGTVGSAAIENIDVSCVARPGLIWDQGNWDAADWQ